MDGPRFKEDKIVENAKTFVCSSNGSTFFHEMSNVEFEIARQKLEEWKVINPISVISSATIPEQRVQERSYLKLT